MPSEQDLAEEANDLQLIDTLLAAMKEAQLTRMEVHREQLKTRVLTYRREAIRRIARGREAENDRVQLQAMLMQHAQINDMFFSRLEILAGTLQRVLKDYNEAKGVDTAAIQKALDDAEGAVSGRFTEHRAPTPATVALNRIDRYLRDRDDSEKSAERPCHPHEVLCVVRRLLDGRGLGAEKL